MAFSFLVTLREGVEMALIIAILLGYLRSIGQKEFFRQIWYGVGVAAVVCLAIGIVLEVVSKEMDKQVLEAFEGFAMIFAAIVLTGMAFWMKKQASGISRELRAQVEQALSRGSMTALVLLAATSVGREGLETVLFLFAGSSNAASGLDFVIGGVLGFAVAAVIGVAIYQGSRWFPVKLFFQVSGVVVLVLAAGLLSNAVADLWEAGIVSNIGDRPWDTDHVISMTSNLGKFMHTLIGYHSAPALAQIILYWGYLVVAVSAFIFLPLGRPPRVAAVPAAGTVPS
jgi:high-affinity iron transporter